MSMWMCFNYVGDSKVYVNRAKGIFDYITINPGMVNVLDDLDRTKNIALSYKQVPKDHSGTISFMRSSSGIGDWINILPSIKFIHEQFPNAKINAVCEREYLDLFLNHPYVKAYKLPVNLEVLGEYIFDMHSVPELSCLPDRTATENFASAIGVDVENIKIGKPELFLDPVTVGQWHSWMTENCDSNLPTIFYQLASSKPMKSYPAEKIFETLMKLDANIILSATPDQLYYYVPSDLVVDIMSGHNKILAPSTPKMRDVFALLSLSDMVISCDSMALHVSNALDIPSVGIWVGVVPPTIIKNECITNVVTKYPCYPCRLHQLLGCPMQEQTGFGPCWRGIVWEELETAIYKVLNQVKK